jgi:hypothetical protein
MSVEVNQRTYFEKIDQYEKYAMVLEALSIFLRWYCHFAVYHILVLASSI